MDCPSRQLRPRLDLIPRSFSSAAIWKARQYLAAGLNVREAAARVKVSNTLYQALKAEKSLLSSLPRPTQFPTANPR